MEILITDMIQCVSGKFNSFSFTEARDNLGQFVGVDVHAFGFTPDEDLQRANLIRVLEIQLKTHLEQMRTLDEVEAILPCLSQNVKDYPRKNVFNCQEYLDLIKGNVKITYFLE